MRFDLQAVTRFTSSRVSGVLLVAVLALAPLATPAHAGPLSLTGFGGWYTESDALFLGLGARIGAATITFNPNVEYQFIDNGSEYSINLDGTMNVLPLGVATGWLGAGVGFYTVSPDHGDSNTDTGYNLLAGASLHLTKLNPFAQIKYVIINGNDPVAFEVGITF
jgi:hypothetical protein